MAQADELEISADLGVYSQYIWRGQAQGDGGASIQGDLGASISGLSASGWFASLGDSNNPGVYEFDWTVDYTYSFDAFDISIGDIYYTYMNNSGANANEIYLALAYNGPVSISAAAYNNTTSKDRWYDFSLGGSIANFDLSASYGYVDPKVGKNESQVLAFGIGKDLSLTEQVTATPSLAYNRALGSLRKNQGGKGDQFVAGINFAY
ncbi:MAG: TorF family putative porin [Mariprofundaceae bacterium]